MVQYILYVAAVVTADQLSKLWILGTLNLYESREVIPGLFNLVYVTNPGAAFSLFADVESPLRHYFFLCIGGAAIIGLTIGSYVLKKESKWYVPAFALIAGGAAGNLIDRIRYGAVIDFLDIYIGAYHWPAFNIADSAICIGAALFIFLSLRQPQQTIKG